MPYSTLTNAEILELIKQKELRIAELQTAIDNNTLPSVILNE